MSRQCLVTGANGFLGRSLCMTLHSQGCDVLAAVRRHDQQLDATGVRQLVIPELNDDNDPTLASSLEGTQTVYHLAARTHSPNADPQAYQRDNEAVTTRLSRLAVAAGVEHFVFVSSVKAMGERSGNGPLTPETAPQPEDSYGRSKLAAEQIVTEQCLRSNTGFSILRPPLIYGINAPGNLSRLIQLLRSGMPLPLASVQNKRSMIGRENLIDLLGSINSKPCNRVLLPHDADWSTPGLIRLLAKAMDRPARLWPFPPPLLRLAGAATGQQGLTDRLTRSLQVDDPWLRDQLGWRPPVPAATGLSEMARSET